MHAHILIHQCLFKVSGRVCFRGDSNLYLRQRCHGCNIDKNKHKNNNDKRFMGTSSGECILSLQTHNNNCSIHLNGI